MSRRATLSELIDFKENYCDPFFPRNLPTWSRVVLSECSEDFNLMEEMKKYLSIRNDNVTATELDSLMQELRDKTNEHINAMVQVQSKEEYYREFTRGLVYYGVLESLDELASFSTELIEEIKKKYGDDYLEIISRFDQSYLSVDGSKVLKATSLDEAAMDDDLLQKYRVLKEWQDKQHGYYQTVIEPVLFKLLDEYEEKYPIPFDIHFESPFWHKRYYDLCNMNLIDVEETARAYLCGIDEELVKLVGGKGYGLTLLKAKGMKIPRTYIIPTTAKDFDISKFPELTGDIHYSARSSADIEDGKKHSFAGMFDSYLNVELDSLQKCIEKVIESKNNSRLQKYISENELTQPNMAVVIEDFVEPEYAGVWMGKDNESGFLEYVKGNGEKLVSGKVTPNREIWENGECSDEKLKCNDGEVGKLLLEYQKKISNGEDNRADFEWMILDNNLIMLQYRPVTSELNITSSLEEEKDVYRGIPASPGVVSGPARFVNARLIDKVTDWKDGDILMAWYTDPEWMNILSHSSAIVTAVGGFLCHAAIIARELGIPCVIGIGGDSMKKIWNEKELTVDGNEGTVKPFIKKKNK